MLLNAAEYAANVIGSQDRAIKEQPNVRVQQKPVVCGKGVLLDPLGLHGSPSQVFPNDSFHLIWILEILLRRLNYALQQFNIIGGHIRH